LEEHGARSKEHGVGRNLSCSRLQAQCYFHLFLIPFQINLNGRLIKRKIDRTENTTISLSKVPIKVPQASGPSSNLKIKMREKIKRAMVKR